MQLGQNPSLMLVPLGLALYLHPCLHVPSWFQWGRSEGQMCEPSRNLKKKIQENYTILKGIVLSGPSAPTAGRLTPQHARALPGIQ